MMDEPKYETLRGTADETIRDVRQSDRDGFLDMAEAFYSTTAVSYSVDRSLLEAAFNEALANSPYVRALIIEDAGAPVGFALLSFSHATEAGGLVVMIEDLYISDTCRGRGLGSKFMQFVEHEYPEAKRFRLEVTKENTGAIGLYSRLGYRTVDYMQMVKDM